MSKHKPKKRAFTNANILEHLASEAAKARHRNNSIRSKVLKTKPETLGRVIFVPLKDSNEHEL